MNSNFPYEKNALKNKLNSLENENKLLKSLIDTVINLSSSINLEENLNKLLENCLEYVNAKNGSILLLDEDKQILRIKASKGLIDKTIKTTEILIGQGISGKIVKNRTHLLYKINAKPDPDFIFNKRSKDRNSSFISLPIINKERIFGVINISDPIDKKEFTENDFKFMLLLSNQIAIIIKNFELYNKFDSITYETILAFVQAIEEMDPNTEGHCQRVTLFSYSIAKEYGVFNDEDLIILQYGAMLHDIGKIGVKKEILNKNGHLTEDEFEAIKKHPELGANIISPITCFNHVKNCILFHHAWYDESGGYPKKKLINKKTKIMANIICVADVYDAMSSTRPYRNKIDFQEIKKIMLAGKGTQFDPKAVDILLGQIEKNKIHETDFLNQNYSISPY